MKQSKRSPGFSLILSLTMMAAVVLLVVSLSAFVTVESRAVVNQQLATRARLNAMVSMRLALAHLQQEAGADRRATARAEITQAAVTPDKAVNPMWTGVWRSDRPDAPPAWLISGRDDLDAGAQSISLSGLADYTSATWTPWQTDYDPSSWGEKEKAARLVALVGIGSASPAAAAQTGQPWTARPNGLVSLPKVTMPTLPADDVTGKYAYWVGDEGIKSRPALFDPRGGAVVNSIENQFALRSPLTHGLLKDLPNQAQLAYLTRIKDAPMLTGFDPVVTKGGSLDMRLYYHDVTAVSAGVLADSNNGGLKRDLSTAFEKSDADFAASEFGSGSQGAATMTEDGYKPVRMPIQYADSSVLTAPIYSRTNANPNAGNVRGPTWWALRDYHLLYKQLGWPSGNPTIRARTAFPNARGMYPNKGGVNNADDIRNEIPVYSDIFAGDQVTTVNPNVHDTYASSALGRAIPRPVQVAITPYVQRASLVFSVNIEYYKVSPAHPYGGADLWLNLTPIVVVHNPYNVAVTWKDLSGPTNGNQRFAALDFTDWQSWIFRFTRYTLHGYGPAYSFYVPLSKFYGQQSSAANKMDMFRVYFPPDLTLQPGEIRVLSCPSTDSTGKKVGMVSWKQATTLVNGFNQTGGFKDENPDWGTGDPNVLWYADDTFGFQVIPGDVTLPNGTYVPPANFRARYGLSCWPGDQMVENNGVAESTFEHYFKTSEHAELFYRKMDAGRIGAPAELKFYDYNYIAWRTSGGYSGVGDPMPPNVIGVFDYVSKTADVTKNGHPLFTHSNPLAPVLRADGAGRLSGTGTGIGLTGPSPSFAARYWRPSGTPTTQWPQIIQAVGGLTYGGYSTSTAGSTSAILTEIPLTQPVSLAQYAHANLTLRDQQPLLSVGNSFASHLVKSSALVQDQAGMANWTEFDHTYLINEALWDGFFLSSLAPRMDRLGATSPYNPTPSIIANTAAIPDSSAISAQTAPPELTPLPTVISNFVSGKNALDNPRFTLISEKSADGSTAAALADYKKAATVLMNQGAFNVNSTSFTAWQCFLGSAKKFAVGLNNPATSPSLAENARFPRTLQTQNMSVAGGTNLQNSTNWTGFANLKDSQIDALAAAIVAENKARFAQSVRTLKTQTPASRIFRGMLAGAQPATPYLSLNEFINRFVSDDAWSSRCGALQAAIFRADKTTAGTASATGFSDRTSGLPTGVKLTKATFDATVGAPDPTFASNAENIELKAQGDTTPRTHTMLAAPGNLLQSDLLQALGSAIATRSDTFTLRCYGEAMQSNGEIGSAWIEAVVQRYPDYLDPTNPAEMTTLPSSATDAEKNAWRINSLLGRRFKVISTRTLKANEI